MLKLGVKLRKAVGSIIAILFIIGAIIIAFTIIEYNIISQGRLREIQEKQAEAERESIIIAKSVTSYWKYTSGLLTIIVKNHYNEPIIIHGVVVIFSDKSYSILSGNSFGFPITVRIGEEKTLGPFTVPKEPSSVILALTTHSIVAKTVSSKYIELNVTAGIPYEIEYLPSFMINYTKTTLGQNIKEDNTSISSIQIIPPSQWLSGNASFILNDDNAYYRVLAGTDIGLLRYRIPITILNSLDAELTDYQVKIVLDDTFAWNHVNPDGSDIRFVNPSGKFIPFYIAYWDYGKLAVIWVKVPSIPARSSTTIYMLYGNPDIEPLTYNLGDVFEFMEVRKVTVPRQTYAGEWFWFNFLNEFKEPPIVIAEPDLTFNEKQELRWRLKGINSTGFYIRQQEPSNRDDKHLSEDVTYVAVPKGSWLIIYNLTSGEGVRIEAGKFQTDKWLAGDYSTVYDKWNPVNYYYPFTTAPIVFSQIQNFTYTGFAHIRIKDVETTSFQTSPEPEGSVLTPPSTLVTVGWVAVEKHVIPGFSEARIGISANNKWGIITFQQTFPSPPYVVAWMQTYNDPDSAGVRGDALTKTSLRVKVEEDKTSDGEKRHSSEDIGYFALNSEYIEANGNKLYLRKYAYPEPQVSIGSEEDNEDFYSIVEVVFKYYGEPLNTRLFLQYLVEGSADCYVKVSAYNYVQGTWDVLISKIYGLEGIEDNIELSLDVKKFVNKTGLESKIRLTTISHIVDHVQSIDMAKLSYLTPKNVTVFIGSGSSFYGFDIATDAPLELSSPPFSFNGDEALTYDEDRGWVWVLDGNQLYVYFTSNDSWKLYSSTSVTLGLGGSIHYFGNRIYVIAGGNTRNFCYIDINNPSTCMPLANIPEEVSAFSVSEIVKGRREIYLVVSGSGSIYAYSIDTDTWSSILDIAPNKYLVGLTYDSDRNYLWAIGKGGGLHYFALSTMKWYPSETQIPYAPQGEGNRLEYYNNKLYHVRNDNTRELWIIYVES